METKVRPMREANFQSSVMAYLRKVRLSEPLYAWKASDKFVAGIPDVMGVYGGRAFGIELKVGKNKPTVLQEATMSALRNAGAKVAVCYTMDEVKAFIEELREEYTNVSV